MPAVALLDDYYLDARYACEALRVVARRRGLRGEAEVLGEGMRLLCGELRALLAREGKGRVSRPFPGELLDQPLSYLARLCLEAARRLEAEGSVAGGVLSEAAGRLIGGE